MHVGEGISRNGPSQERSVCAGSDSRRAWRIHHPLTRSQTLWMAGACCGRAGRELSMTW